MAELQDLIVRIRADTKQLDTALKGMQGNLKQAESGVSGLATRFGTLKTAVAGYLSLRAGQAVGQQADAYINLSNRLKVSADSQEEFNHLFGLARTVARETNSTFEDSVGMITRLDGATKNLNISQNDLGLASRAAMQAIQLSGSTAAEASGVVIQFSQALSGTGSIGQELNSILEQSPRLADALAEGLNNVTGRTDITRGSLKKMNEEGLLESKLLMEALISVAPELQQQFEQMRSPMSKAFAQLTDQLMVTVGSFDEVLGVSDAVVATFQGLQWMVEGLTKGLVTFAASVKLGGAELANFAGILDDDRLKQITDDTTNLIKRMYQEVEIQERSAEQIELGLGKKGGKKSAKEHVDEFQAAIEDARFELQLYEKGINDTGQEVAKLARQHKLVNDLGSPVSDEAQAKIAEYYRLVEQLNIAEKVRKKQQDDIADATEKTESLASDLGFAFNSAFEDAILKGGELRDVINGIGEDIGRVILRRSITEPLAGAVGGFADNLFTGKPWLNPDTGETVATPGFLGGVGDFFSNIFGREGGGGVNAGQPYVVGEKGAEIFVPNTAGAIMNRSQMSGAVGGVTVVQNMTFTSDIKSTVRDEIASAAPIIANATKQSLINDVQRGGATAKVFGVR